MIDVNAILKVGEMVRSRFQRHKQKKKEEQRKSILRHVYGEAPFGVFDSALATEHHLTPEEIEPILADLVYPKNLTEG